MTAQRQLLALSSATLDFTESKRVPAFFSEILNRRGQALMPRRGETYLAGRTSRGLPLKALPLHKITIVTPSVTTKITFSRLVDSK